MENDVYRFNQLSFILTIQKRRNKFTLIIFNYVKSVKNAKCELSLSF